MVRTPAEMSAYHRFENSVFATVLDRLRGTQTVVLPRTPQQRAELGDGLIVPDRVVDTQSLIAYADLVVSAGGTMNREAVALGTPVWTTFEGRLGAVDASLIASGRMRRLESPDDIVLAKRTATAGRTRPPRPGAAGRAAPALSPTAAGAGRAAATPAGSATKRTSAGRGVGSVTRRMSPNARPAGQVGAGVCDDGPMCGASAASSTRQQSAAGALSEM